MIRKKFIKTFALFICMSAIFSVKAYGQSGEGIEPTPIEIVSDKDSALYEKQREINQYLFIEHANELEEKGIIVIYTGIADNYVEVGITPYSEENAKFLYQIFGDDMVKVVDSEEPVLLEETKEAPDMVDESSDNNAVDTAVSNKSSTGNTVSSDKESKNSKSDNTAAPKMDIGEETPVVDSDIDKVIKERELMAEPEAEDKEELSVQIETINTSNEPELGTTDKEESIELDVGADIAYTDDLVLDTDLMQEIAHNNNRESKKKDTSLPIIIGVSVGGILLVGGTVFVVFKKKTP